MTTFYIEEITSSDEEGEEEEDDQNDAIQFDHTTTPKDSKGQISIDENAIDIQSNLFFNSLMPCPVKIGGGASLTIIKTKAFVFGGCNRSGQPSSELHCYDFGMSLSPSLVG